eukprot:1158718-Pelagomonas_calceolata.AAC.6
MCDLKSLPLTTFPEFPASNDHKSSPSHASLSIFSSPRGCTIIRKRALSSLPTYQTFCSKVPDRSLASGAPLRQQQRKYMQQAYPSKSIAGGGESRPKQKRVVHYCDAMA